MLKMNKNQIFAFCAGILWLIFLIPVIAHAQFDFPTANMKIDQLVDLQLVREIALAKAEALWGQVAPGKPIPCCDDFGNIAVYMIPFRIGAAEFPSYREIMKELEQARAAYSEKVNSSKHAPMTGAEYQNQIVPAYKKQFGIGQYGTIFISARQDRFPIPLRAHYLSPYYVVGDLALDKAQEALGTFNVRLNRYFFLDIVRGQLFEFISPKDTVFVHAYSLEVEPRSTLISKNLPIKTASPEMQNEIQSAWQQVRSSAPIADHTVNNPELIPPILWCRGCSPTSASMVLGYWDNMVDNVAYTPFGKLIDYWQELSRYSNGAGGMRNVPNILEELRLAMGTDVLGSTWSDDIGPGIEHVCNEINKYDFDSDQHHSSGGDWNWGRITDEIDDSRPFVWSLVAQRPDQVPMDTVGHSLCAWGYDDEKNVFTYNTWSLGQDDWYYIIYNDTYPIFASYVNTVEPGGGDNTNVYLSSPIGGEVIYSDYYFPIEWVHQGPSTVTLKVYYSSDAGENWNFWADITSTTGTHTLVGIGPSQVTQEGRLRIEGWRSNQYIAGDGSRNNFEVREAYIRIISPNGGEIWQAGTTQNIRWSSDFPTGIVKIKYSTDGGTSWNIIDQYAIESQYNGVYPWDVPDTPSDNCLLLIQDAEPGFPAIDQSNAPFTILPAPYITVIEPNGGEEIAAGSDFLIKWDAFDTGGLVNIYLSTNGGSTWNRIYENLADDGEHLWQDVPNAPSSNCKIKITNASGTLLDTSDGPFTIKSAEPVLTVIPQELVFFAGQTSKAFQIKNIGSDLLVWTVTESPDLPWIGSVAPTSGTNDASITVTIDPNHFGDSNPVGAISVASNGGNQTVKIEANVEITNLPQDWNFSARTGQNASVLLPASIIPEVGIPPILEDGDYIGVFTEGGRCCGYAQWHADENLAITAWGDDPQTTEIDGFPNGGLIVYRVYKLGNHTEYENVDVAYSEGDGHYHQDEIMTLSQFTITEYEDVVIPMNPGWGLVDCEVIPFDPSIYEVFDPIIDYVKLVKNGRGEVFIPAYGIDQIGEINFWEGYQVYLTQAASLTITGTPIDPEYPIPLESGWNMIAYLPRVPINADVALAGIADNLVIAKDGQGRSYIPAFSINQIGEMQMGLAYQMYLSEACTLRYPPGNMTLSGSSRAKSIAKMHLQHFQFTVNTSGNATIVIPSDIHPGSPDGGSLHTGDEIGVFTPDGLCCGAVVWEGENTALTVWSNNQMTEEIDGFRTGETMLLRIWQQHRDTEFPATIAVRERDTTIYNVNGFTVLTQLIGDLSGTSAEFMSQSSIPTAFRLLQNYPNPFNPATVIRYELPEAGSVTLEIYNHLGQRIRTLVQREQPAGIHHCTWDGKNESGKTVPSGVYFYRLQSKVFSATKKMLFMH
ncbi:T9SS type A sorting domain-containing protein [candidate division KSB1 bacterium]|nr:T9SS type A sorting domain-containing protein [candidate division KSB1 bacterium]